jgi:hypothetical protein
MRYVRARSRLCQSIFGVSKKCFFYVISGGEPALGG